MRHLIDSHSLIWYVDQDHLLGPAAHGAMTGPNNDLLLSAATIWEIGIKVGLNKLSLSMPFRKWMNKAIADLRLSVLPITVEYAAVQGALPPHHRDPFDRLLVAQAMVEKVPIISADSIFDQYGVTRLWK
ncbi:MAG TPA: type II toxin-antitoxin system VapC family toxin [Pirellulales bacterium]|nr:type II toxin-antitoxin system VapC family toxin [Pirellulales bacterium]